MSDEASPVDPGLKSYILIRDSVLITESALGGQEVAVAPQTASPQLRPHRFPGP